MGQLVLEEPNKSTWETARYIYQICTRLFLNHPFNESLQRPLLEKLEVGGWYHCHITKVHIVHLHLSGRDHLMDHHPVEPHSVR